MEDKEVIEILKSLLKKKTLNLEEREAILTAIGILSWSALGQSRIKNIGRAQRIKTQLAKNLKK